MKKTIKIKESKLRELIRKSILRETSYRNLAHMAVPGETDAELEKNWVGRTTAGMNMDDYGNNGDISGFIEPKANKLKSKKAQSDASWDAYDEVAGIADLYRDNYEDFYDLDKNVNYDDDRSHAMDYVNHDAYFVGDDPDPIAEAVKKSIKKVLNEKDAQEQLQESKLRAIIKEGIQKVLSENDFAPHGYMTTSNLGGKEIEISNSNDAVRFRTEDGSISDWFEIEYDEEGNPIVNTPWGTEDLNNYMRFN